MKSIFTLFIVSLMLAGCMEFNHNEVIYNHEIVGTWSNINSNEAGFTMERVKKLENNIYGYVFFNNGAMIARQNAGWCGTPPIITADYDGFWRIENGKILITLNYWGGETIQEWNISSSDKKQLTIQINPITKDQRE